MIKILHISDIHYGWKKPEEDGVVLEAFFDDLKQTLSGNHFENYCIISGDLVHKGGNDHEYEEFYNGFIHRLIKHMPLSHIIVTPGNHDLSQRYVSDNLKAHQTEIHRLRTEVEFNEYVDDKEKCQLREKFASFEKFCTDKLRISEFDLSGYYRNFSPEVSIYMLNSAWCSSGGAKDENGNEIIDKGVLRVNTNGLNKWISENKGRTKILVMHHPIEHLTDDTMEQLYAICRNGVDFLFAGHTHSQNLISYQDGACVVISPQLFSEKKDLNGYSVINVEGANIVDISYRQWSSRFRKFMIGTEFVGTDDGKWTNPDLRTEDEKDFLQKTLLRTLDNAMTIYSTTPSWIHRRLSPQTPNQYHEKRERDLDYVDLLNSDKSYHIIAPSQFGLTCYAHYLSYIAWKEHKKHWVYVDCKNWSLSKVQPEITKAAQIHGISVEDIDCLLLDNWRNNFREVDKIARKLKGLMQGKRLIILTHGTDVVSVDLATQESHEGFIDLYLREIRRQDLHDVVNSVDNKHEIEEEYVVVERLNQDLISLNMHRTPLNSLQFVVAYRKTFEKRPVNRTKVMDCVLRAIFDNPGTLTYSDEIDDENCKFIMGYFCQYLIENDRLFFTEEEFVKICKPFADEQYNSTNLHNLLQVLINNQILEAINAQLQFKMVCWVSYFAADRMINNPEFANYMFEEKNAIYNTDLIDFYTGITGRNEDAITKIAELLDKQAKIVYEHLGIDKNFNPFDNIKWSQNETIQGATQKQLEEKIKSSRMPDEIKEVVADSSFDSVRPYSQQIYKFFDKYEVRNLMQLLTSASRALRNSEFGDPALREKLAESIFSGWEVLMRVLVYISPLMAKNGFGGLGGANFKLDKSFSKNYAECLKQIIVAMPYNIIRWYKNDFYSDKLTLLLKKYLMKHDSEFIRHLVALIICSARPRDFEDLISPYIGSLGKNTYYLGDLYTSLRLNYSFDFMSRHELKQTENLIKSCYMKHLTGSTEPGPATIAKFERMHGKLPNRKSLEG